MYIVLPNQIRKRNGSGGRGDDDDDYDEKRVEDKRESENEKSIKEHDILFCIANLFFIAHNEKNGVKNSAY